jgi:hypothetical protein
MFLSLFAFNNTKAQTLLPSNIPDGVYHVNQTIVEITGFKLVYQGDGNLVLYSKGSNARALWGSQVLVSDAATCTFGWDIKLFGSSNYSSPYWTGPSNLYSCQYSWVLQDDGNLVRYTSDCNGNVSSVDTGTNGGQVSSHFGSLQ